jgi:hypothetical protein
MFNINVKRQRDKTKKAELREAKLQEGLKEKRETLSIEAHKRMKNWLEGVDPEGCKTITDGAKKNAVINPSANNNDS